jgi:hypothetical protein
MDLHALQRMVRVVDPDSVLAALPHALTGYKLAGHCADTSAMRDMLHAMGANPLVSAAFRNRAA